MIRLLVVMVLVFLIFSYKSNVKENWGGSSPGTGIQLGGSSGYYPIQDQGFVYEYPGYRYKYPYFSYYPMGYHHTNGRRFKYGLY